MNTQLTALVNRAGPGHVALETTLLLHGVPKERGPLLAAQLADAVRGAGAEPALIGVVRGRPVAGLTDAELTELFAAPRVKKANTSNIGILMHRGEHAATTVGTTMEVAAAAGVRVFATGGLGGVHPNVATHLDISSDLAALTRFPVAVVTSGVKSILDVEGTRELLETLGVPVVGYGTDSFPSFYRRGSGAGVDARFDDLAELAAFVDFELARTRRGVVIANPIPVEHELPESSWSAWLAQAERETSGHAGRDVTPALLGALHRVSGGRTLEANVQLVLNNARVAGAVCGHMQRRTQAR